MSGDRSNAGRPETGSLARKIIWNRINYSDRGSQYLSIHYSERVSDAKIEASVGSVSDAYDNVLAETVNGFIKAVVIHRRRSWLGFDTVELYSTREWVD